VKRHGEGEFVFDFAWADAAERAGIRYYPKLLVGVPFTPVTGARFLVASGQDREAWTRRLAACLRELCAAHGFSGVHVNFCREDEREALERAGFLPRLGLQYHWRNDAYPSFDAYLERFRSKRRNQIRRERREVRAQGIAIETLAADAIDASHARLLFELYRSTVDRHPWGRRYLNARLFELLVERFRHRLWVCLARRGEEVVGGTVNVWKNDTLYGRYWGALDEVRHLHFEVCYYAGIEHCIQSGLARFEPGAGGDYKQVRGFDAQPTWSAHWLADRRLADAVRQFLERERQQAGHAIEWLRERSALKPEDGGPAS
jgi:predicted N-acyltransferase